MSLATASAGTAAHPRGIRVNLGQFTLQTVQVFFVGLTIGMERTVLPSLSAQFGVAQGAFLFLASFVISFGLVKGALNFVAGSLADRIGRKTVLLKGWLAGLPIPVLIFFAPNWWWIVAANVFLGINQAFTWTMTVTMHVDLAGDHQRGLAVGIDEAAGYAAVGLSGLGTGFLAAMYGPRWALLMFGFAVIAAALLALIWVRDTLAWVHAEHAQMNAAGKRSAGDATLPSNIFLLVSFRHPTYRALCQGGVVNKIADTLVWVMFPVYFRAAHFSVVAIGAVTGIYAMVWGVSQLWTGHLADRIGRKPPIVVGFALLALGIAVTAASRAASWWGVAAAIMGLGMALLYPNLIAALADLAPPLWRGRALGTYRYWRDTGYALGALLLGVVADLTGGVTAAMWGTVALVALSGLWIALAVEESRPRQTMREVARTMSESGTDR
ncbi:MAG: MFS transporter [Steroidobacteraceae bacterium]